jgi:DNA-binding transcriptional LysR family regulator
MRWLEEKLKIPRLTRTRIVLAFAVSVIADALEFPINAATATGILALPAEAVDLVLDSVVMVITCALLGFHWSLLPSFLLEAVPGLDLIPTWTGCVAFVVWRRKKEQARASAPRIGGDIAGQ